MNNAVIFGGCGYIGLFYAEKVLDLNLFNNLYLIDLQEPIDDFCKKKYQKLLNTGKVKFIKRDIRENLNDIKIDGILKTVLNLAAIHREPGHQPHEYYETNIKGAENICNFAEIYECKNIIFTSSIAVYGQGEHNKDEDTKTIPTTP